MKNFAVHSISGVLALLAFIFLVPRMMEPVLLGLYQANMLTETSLLGVICAAFIVAGMIGGGATAVGQWLIGEFKKDRDDG